MTEHLYNCNYCGKDYLPKRRNKQKYCSNSCRVNAFNQRQKFKKELSTCASDNNQDHKKDNINLVGIGNAFIANLAYDGTKSIFKSSKNKPATKADISEIKESLNQRFFPVSNAPKRHDGTHPYYDKMSGLVVYLKNIENGK